MFGLDICLCSGIGCKLRDTCLRYRYHLKAKKEDYNTYFEKPPIENGRCDFYIKSLIDE